MPSPGEGGKLSFERDIKQPGTHRQRADGCPRRYGDDADPAAGHPSLLDSDPRIMMRLGHPEPYGPARPAAGYPTRGPPPPRHAARSALPAAASPQRHGAHHGLTGLQAPAAPSGPLSRVG